MSLTVEPKAFRAAVEAVAPTAASVRSNTILQHVRLTAEDGLLTVSAMGMEGTAVRRVPLESPAEADLLLPHKILSTFAKSARSLVTIEPDGRDGANLRSGASRARLPGLDASDFPRMPSWDGAETVFEGDLQAFAAIAGRVSPVAIRDPKSHAHARKCVLYRVGGSVASAAAAGDVMFAVAAGHAEGAGEWLLPAPLVDDVPTEGVGTIARLADGRYGARGEGWCVTHAALDLGGKFPAYESKMPSGQNVRCLVPRADLSAAIARVRAMAEGAEIVALVLTPDAGGLRVSLRDSADGRAAEETVPGSCDGEPFAMDARWIAKALDVLAGDETRIAYDGPRSPVLFLGSDDAKVVVQPMQVSV